MKVITNVFGLMRTKPILSLFVIAISAGVAGAQPGAFLEDFAAPPLDPNWTQGGDLAGHLGIVGGSYFMTDDFGAPGVKLSRTTGGSLDTYTHEIDVVLDPFLLTGSGGTKSDFKWKTFGADGFMEIVLNSFGDMRLFHNDSDGGAGNIQPNTNIGYADGDLLNLTTAYDVNTDTLNVTYSLNGGATVPFYSGGGIDGPVDDLITNFVEVEMFKFDDNPTDQASVGIDQWNLLGNSAVPEPTSVALWFLMGTGLMGFGCRRRRRS